MNSAEKSPLRWYDHTLLHIIPPLVAFFTKLLMLSYGTPTDTSYANINEAIGVVECVKLEYYRKVAETYEDKKELINGPISPTVEAIVVNPTIVEKK